MIRILHTADLHLDKEFFPEDPKFSALRRKEQRALFANIMMYARDKKVDILIFAGDLLDKTLVSEETGKLLLREFENTPETEIFIVPGRSDPYRPGSFYATARFPGNVHIFTDERISEFEIERLNTVVYGYAFTRKNMTHNPFSVMPPVNRARINLLCACGSLTGKEGCCPIKTEEIEHSGVDYLALGYDHTASELQKAGQTFYAVAGSPEGLSFDEPGQRGARIVVAEKNENGELLLESKKVRFSRRTFARVSLDATGLTDCLPLVDRLAAEMKRIGADADTLLEAEISGEVPTTFRLKKEYFERLSEKLCRLTLTDKTLMLCEGGEGGDFRSVLAEKTAAKTPDPALRSEILKCAFGVLEETNGGSAK